MLVNDTLPNLFNGISQQPPSLRHRTQGDLQINCYPSVADGNKKRPPSKHVSVLSGVTTTADSFSHFITQSATARYELIINTSAIHVYDALTGATMTVSTPDGTSYLNVANPAESLVAVTVADYTFIVNKTQVVALAVGLSSGTLTGTKQKFADLPASPALNDLYRIEGTPETNFDDYYVVWDGTVWVETVKPGIQCTLDAATMPHQLIKTGATTFTFQKATWPARLVGDLVSNPAPSFVGKTITDVYFFRNRLGFLAGENYILSRSGEPFTFWAETATAVLDSDPIDKAIQHDKVSTLTHAVPFNKVLMLFSEQAQFQLSTGDAPLTPTTGEATMVTEFESSSIASPVGAGQTLFFSVARSAGTSIREYYVDVDAVANDAADITAHVPRYVPSNVFRLASSTTEDVLMILSKSERNAVYLYKYYWASRDEKVQSSWGKWTFGSDAVILDAAFFNNVVYLLVSRSGVAVLEKIDLDGNAVDTGLAFTVLLDRRVEITGSYDAGNGWTTWTLPYSQAGTLQVVLGSAFSDFGSDINVTRPSDTTVRATGDWSAGACFIGVPYTQQYRFSTIYFRDNEKVTMEDARLQILRMIVLYDNTGYFRVEVTPRGRSKNTYAFTAKNVGVTVIGDINIAKGSFRFPVLCRNTDATIDLINDSYLPSSFQSAEWIGDINPKAQRR